MNGATLTLTYDKTLDTGSVPAGSAFTVKVGGSGVNLAGTTPVGISGTTVTLTLAAAVTHGEAVTVSYARPGSNPLQDEEGNVAADLTDRTVSNDTPPPAVPVSLEVVGYSSIGEGRGILDVAQTVVLTVYATYTDGSSDSPTAVWRSSDPAVLGLPDDATGSQTEATGLSGGEAELSVSVHGVTATVRFSVWWPFSLRYGSRNVGSDGLRPGSVIGQSLAAREMWEMYEGESLPLWGSTRQGRVHPPGSITWVSSDPRIVVVEEWGFSVPNRDDGDFFVRITGLREGESDVTFTYLGASRVVHVEVFEAPYPRRYRDMPDDVSGPQIHAIYAVPPDVHDDGLDRAGRIATSFEAIQNYLSEKVGYRLRLDTYGGELDVTYLPLVVPNDFGSRTGSDIGSETIEAIEATIGRRDGKVYAVFYAGSASDYQGVAFLFSRTANVFIHPGSGGWAGPGRDPEILDLADLTMVHELLHVFGAVPPCAPHYNPGGSGHHVQDDPQDVMYAGNRENGPQRRDLPIVIDAARDDYFEHGIPDCRDTADSPYWERVGFRRSTSRDSRIRISAGEWPIRCGFH